MPDIQEKCFAIIWRIWRLHTYPVHYSYDERWGVYSHIHHLFRSISLNPLHYSLDFPANSRRRMIKATIFLLRDCFFPRLLLRPNQNVHSIEMCRRWTIGACFRFALWNWIRREAAMNWQCREESKYTNWNGLRPATSHMKLFKKTREIVLYDFNCCTFSLNAKSIIVFRRKQLLLFRLVRARTLQFTKFCHDFCILNELSAM